MHAWEEADMASIGVSGAGEGVCAGTDAWLCGDHLHAGSSSLGCCNVARRSSDAADTCERGRGTGRGCSGRNLRAPDSDGEFRPKTDELAGRCVLSKTLTDRWSAVLREPEARSAAPAR